MNKHIPTPPFHIACNIDSNYVKHCAVTLVSLFENNRAETFAVHILANDLQQTDKDLLVRLAGQYGHGVHFHTPDAHLLAGFTIRKFSKRISLATYYRCVLSEVLPASIDRLLYLDCDIVVRGPIRPFLETPLEGIGVAAVEDIGCREAQRYDILQYPAAHSYFNAGVLLVNLAYWREHDVAGACIDYYHTYPERILFNDQDLLNCVLHGSKRLVGLKWNVQDGFYRRPRHLDQAWKERYTEALKHPVILHYTNRKPWDYDSQHPLRQEYLKYLDLTPWQGWRPLAHPGARLKRFLRLLPFHTGLRRPKYVDMNAL